MQLTRQDEEAHIVKPEDILPSDRIDLLSEIKRRLHATDCSTQNIQIILDYLAHVFFVRQDDGDPGLNVLTPEQKEALREYLILHKSNKNILNTLLILNFIESNVDEKATITLKFLKDAYALCGLEGQLAQQIRDYGPKSRHSVFITEESGGYRMTEAAREYVAKFVSLESESE